MFALWICGQYPAGNTLRDRDFEYAQQYLTKKVVQAALVALGRDIGRRNNVNR
jgi:hypothetical protein